jgi:hypothetical protein
MGFGPCMCGDIRCSSCGPAQGNSRCQVCGKWLDDGGCDNPDECAKKSAEMDEAYAKQEQEWAEMEAKWEREGGF